MSRSDDERCAQLRYHVFHLISHARETIQAQFEQIRRPAQPQGSLQIGARRDHPDNPRTPLGWANGHHFFVTGGLTILSTYLARRSNSRFTRSPAVARSRLV